jgi:PAS domain S-box-containing protein
MAKTRIPKDDDEEKIMKENIQKRFKNIFSGKGQPLSNLSLQEVEALKGRVAALEAELEHQPEVAEALPGLTQGVGSLQASSSRNMYPTEPRPSDPPVLPSEEQSRPGKVNLWQRLIEPVSLITGVTERRQARLVSVILLIMILALSIGTFMNTFVIVNPSVARILAGADLTVGIAYLLSRTRHYRLAVPLLLIVFLAIPVLSVGSGTIHDPEQLITNLIFNVLMVLLCSALMSTRTTVFFAAGNMLLLLLFPIIFPDIPFGNMAIPLIYNGIMSGIILVLAQHRKLVENDRLAEVSQLNQTLESRNAALSARTRDLNLAAEAARSLSSLRDLDTLLAESVNLIQSQFDLYHTQVYLVDPSGRTLILRAGTGEAGAELLRREHHLSVGPGSINGRAAAEKRTIFVSDTTQSADFLPNPLLPKTRSQISIPLLAGDVLLGVLNMQHDSPDTLHANNLTAFEAVAGQLSIAIQNARLFDEVEQARAEIEARTRSATGQGWQEFLDGIDRGQRIGFEFKKSEIVRLEPDALLTSSQDQDLSIPITVTGTKIGEILLPIEQDHAWMPNEQELIKVTSAQLAQHIENLRLLAQAERFRAEAEQAVRRLTREGWETYQQLRADEAPGYVFNLVSVEPLTARSNGHVPSTLRQPLSIRGEAIGELAVDGLDHQAEATELITAVAEQLSQHVENLRLAEETEKRSSELATVAGQLSEALDIARLANWEYDVARDRFIFNDHFYSIFHTSAQEVGGYEISSAEYAARFVHPDDVPLVGQEIGKALASTDRHYSVHLEHRILFTDGGLGHISVDVHIERDEQGNILRYYGANQDITERKKAELVIQESEARLSEALEIAKLANWEYDLERDIFTFNDQFYSIFHTTADKVGGYELSSAQYAQLFVHPDDAALVGVEIGKAIASPDRLYTKQLEHRILFADGGVGYIAVDINIERDESGKITRWYGANQDITERKKAELVIQESEARLSEALEIARLANWEYDVVRDRFLFNDHFYSIFHTSAQEVGGYEISSAEYAARFVHPDDVPLVGQEIGKALASTDRHYNVQLEHRILYADGGVGYIAVNVHIERDEQGNILRYYGANQDITERKLAEEAIKAEQQRTQAILQSVTVPMVITRLSDNHLVFVNAPALEVTQYRYEEVINQPSPNFYYNLDDRKKFITELRAKGEVADMVVQLRNGNEEVFWALMSARIFDYQGQASILTTFLDISERVRAEEAIAKRATELATVAQVSTTASTVLDPDKLLQSVVDLTKEKFSLYHAHIYLADSAWQLLLLAAGAGEVGRKMVAEGWNIPLDHESSIVAGAARSRKTIVANDVYHDKDSQFLSNRLLPDTRSEMAVPMIVGEIVLGVFDVQADKVDYFTEEDVNIYITLATQVGVALQNARLYVEQAATLTQLRELDKLKSSFLANMSHELRTPLNSILGFTDVILEELDGPLTEHMDNDLRLIQKNGQHLLHLINDVLDMAKIEAGRMNLSPENFKAFEVMEEVTSITSTLASEKNLALFIDETSEQDVEIYADRTRLRQVMINLVNNAIKFTEAGKISLKVTSLPGARVLIAVQDTGIGIAPDKLEAIFQEFTQVDASSTRKAGGTGLGLPISRRLVEMHGGRLWAESTGIPGEGSTFFVELPIEARITEVVEKQAS